VEGTIRGYFGRRRMEAAIRKLNGHYILCGYGRVGRQVAAEFALDDLPFVIIEQEPETVEECIEKGYLVLPGEASDDGVLEAAGVRRARGCYELAQKQLTNAENWGPTEDRTNGDIRISMRFSSRVHNTL
jgi:voltage-gated potassium channel